MHLFAAPTSVTVLRYGFGSNNPAMDFRYGVCLPDGIYRRG